MLMMISTINKGKKTVGYRVLNTSTKEVYEVTEDILMEQIKNRQVKVDNLKYYNKQLLGVNGSIARYSKLCEELKLQDTSKLVIIGRTGDHKFICSNYTGRIIGINEDDAVKYATKNGIANGQIKKGRISSIVGNYRLIGKVSSNE